MGSTVPHAHCAVWVTVGVVRDGRVRPPRAAPPYCMYFSTLRLCSWIERGLAHRPPLGDAPASRRIHPSARRIARPCTCPLCLLHVLLDVALVLVDREGA